MKAVILAAGLALIGTVALSGCQTAQTQAAAPAPMAKAAPAKTGQQMTFEQALAEARAELKKAASMGGEWRDTGKHLKKAEALAAKGDYAAAMKLVAQAKFEAMAGQKQAAGQAGVGNPDYLY